MSGALRMLAALSIGAGIGWVARGAFDPVGHASSPVAATQPATTVVARTTAVAGSAPALETAPAPVAAPAETPRTARALDRQSMDFLRDAMHRIDEQATIDFQAQTRSAVWAEDHEARIKAISATGLAGGRIDSIDCRTTMCQIVVTVPTSSAREVNRHGEDDASLQARLDAADLDVITISGITIDNGMSRYTLTMRPESTPISPTKH